MLSGKQEAVLVVAKVFVEPFSSDSRCTAIQFVFAPRVGEAVDISFPSFAKNVRGKISRIIHTSEVQGGPPRVYVFITPDEDN